MNQISAHLAKPNVRTGMLLIAETFDFMLSDQVRTVQLRTRALAVTARDRVRRQHG